MHPPLLLAAVNLEILFIVAFVVISAIGGLINLVGDQKKPTRKGDQPKRPNREGIREELERLVREAAKKKQAPVELTADDIEIVETPKRPNRPVRPAPTNRPPAPQTPRKPVSGRPMPGETGSRLAQTVFPTDSTRNTNVLGQGIRDHVQVALAPRVAAAVARDVPRTLDQKVTAHLGSFSGSPSGGATTPITLREGSAAASSKSFKDLMVSLRNPEMVRQAILMQEILSPPLSLRKPSRSDHA